MISKCKYSSGIDINYIGDKHGVTAAYLSMYMDDTDCVELLAEVKDVDWNVKDTYNGDTGLTTMAARHNMNECLKILKTKDVDIDWNLQNDDGDTAVMVAVMWTNDGCLKILRDVPQVDWNLKNNNGESALTLNLNQINHNWFNKKYMTEVYPYVELDPYISRFHRIHYERKGNLKVLEILLNIPDLNVNIQELNNIKDAHKKAVAFCKMHVADKMPQNGENLPEVVFALMNNFSNNIIKILLSDPSAVQECRRYVAGIMTGRVHKEENITELVFTLKNNMDPIAQVLIDNVSNIDIICLVLSSLSKQP